MFPEIQTYFFESLPIKIISNKKQKPFVEKAEKLIDLKNKLYYEKNSFINLLKTKLEIGKATKKLDVWYNLELKEFEQELSKLKVKLSLKKEKEWQEFFISEQKEMKPILVEIEQAENK